MTGLIEMHDMEFYAYHGCYDTEKQVGGRFLVNLWLEYNAAEAAVSDDINKALNYATAYEIVAKEMSITSSLLEHVCKRILDALFEAFPELLVSAQVDVSKMAPPIGGKMRDVTVTLRREKESDLETENEEPESNFPPFIAQC